MEEEIHFLVDEIKEKLDKDIKSVLQQIKDPKAKQRAVLVSKFTRALAKASYPLPKKRETKPLPSIEQYKIKPPRLVSSYKLPKIPTAYHQPYYASPSPPQPMQQLVPSPVATESIPRASEIPSPPIMKETKETTPVLPKPEEAISLTKETLELAPPEKEEHTVETTPIELPEQPEKQEPIKRKPEKIALIKESATHKTVVTAEIKDNAYTVMEPYLSADDKKLLTQMRKDILENPAILKDKEKVYKQLRKSAKKVKVPFDAKEEAGMHLRYYLVRNILNLGLIEPLLHDDKIEKIICEGVQKPVIIIRDGQQLKTNVIFTQQDMINGLLFHVAKKTYQKLSIEEPILDATYKNYHVQGTLGSDLVPAKFIVTRE